MRTMKGLPFENPKRLNAAFTAPSEIDESPYVAGKEETAGTSEGLDRA